MTRVVCRRVRKGKALRYTHARTYVRSGERSAWRGKGRGSGRRGGEGEGGAAVIGACEVGLGTRVELLGCML